VQASVERYKKPQRLWQAARRDHDVVVRKEARGKYGPPRGRVRERRDARSRLVAGLQGADSMSLSILGQLESRRHCDVVRMQQRFIRAGQHMQAAENDSDLCPVPAANRTPSGKGEMKHGDADHMGEAGSRRCPFEEGFHHSSELPNNRESLPQMLGGPGRRELRACIKARGIFQVRRIDQQA